MTMLELLPEIDSMQTGYYQLTLLSEAFPAKIYPLPVNKKVLPMKKATPQDQDYGLKCSELFKKSDPLGWSLRMSVGLSISPSIRSQVTLKVKVTKSGQSSFLHVRWVRPTKGKDCSLWATPNTMDCLPSRSYEAMMRQATNGGRKNRTRPGNLREQIDPLMCQAYDEAKARANGQMWRTPDANCFRGASSEERMQWKLDNGMPISINDQVRHNGDKGQLNPDWVEILMGFPVGWTDIEVDEMYSAGWPAYCGQEQYDYEPPKVTTISKNRKDRLKAIGNAVCPKQATPVFMMIREWENE